MKLSKKGEYALRALIRLGDSKARSVLSIQEIARQEKIPKKFLEQVLLALKKADIVQSSRGKAGGYTLRDTPTEVTLGDIVRAVDGPLVPLPCSHATAPMKCEGCLSLENCWLRAVMMEVGEAITEMLDRITLAVICRRAAESRRRNAEAPMYQI